MRDTPTTLSVVATDDRDADAVLQALDDFEFGETGGTSDDATPADRVVQLGRPPQVTTAVWSVMRNLPGRMGRSMRVSRRGDSCHVGKGSSMRATNHP